MDKQKIKELCQQLNDELGDVGHYSYVFGNRVLAGAALEVSKFGVSEGIDNKLIGTPHQCANVFYNLILIYLKQIQHVLDFSGNEVITALTYKLMRDFSEFDDCDPVIKCRKSFVYKGGTA